ncbi:hypothetical protein QBC46DRAFT_137442 [Diplogelasinospora grovesii]|uniref:Uncharacterized protein n=1 Tax=Diplogelasinospora grovesii TaxID=303347 RepID=A0AAN6N712_9PEZI|nr:hypothetical protein QBC46DRAFT_137442 [Diplogelasinospora grovesii]
MGKVLRIRHVCLVVSDEHTPCLFIMYVRRRRKKQHDARQTQPQPTDRDKQTEAYVYTVICNKKTRSHRPKIVSCQVNNCKRVKHEMSAVHHQQAPAFKEPGAQSTACPDTRLPAPWVQFQHIFGTTTVIEPQKGRLDCNLTSVLFCCMTTAMGWSLSECICHRSAAQASHSGKQGDAENRSRFEVYTVMISNLTLCRVVNIYI